MPRLQFVPNKIKVVYNHKISYLFGKLILEYETINVKVVCITNRLVHLHSDIEIFYTAFLNYQFNRLFTS